MVQLRVRARAVDMLGRQQIAGIPTAIHELFKNAHDAYAERVEIDYFRRTGILVLRDDGLGMTRDEVENRWLTIGTESRLGANQEKEVWTGPKNLPRRAIMGEKGIGRLAIAAIAPVTLLMTRAIRPDGLHDLVVALVHWGLFEQPGLDVSSIDVPLLDFKGGDLPGKSDIAAMIAHIRENLHTLKSQLQPSEFERIDKQLSILRIAPDRMDQVLNAQREQPLSLAKDGYGTTFVLLPTVPELDDDIDGGTDKDASLLEKMLLGFSNTMSGKEPLMATAFRDHGLDGETNERIGDRSFFQTEDISRYDHHFKGEFDEYGQFHGHISIYRNEPVEFICNWPEGRGRLTKCGPFSTECFYIMGRQAESKIEVNVYEKITAKLERIGGIYIYRDGIRVLPYGDSDYDFLEIEKRRTKSAQDWFFSYRRLFGYAALTHADNQSLSEKAGREGFRQNQGYRDFRALLMNLFRRLALEYFRPTSPQSEIYWDQKDKYKAAYEALKKQKKKSKERMDKLSEELELFFNKHETGVFENQYIEIKRKASTKIMGIESIEIPEHVGEAVRRFDKDIQNDLRDLEKDLSSLSARGVTLKGKLEADWASYQRISQELKTGFIDDLRTYIGGKLAKITKKPTDSAQRREAVLEDLSIERDRLMKELTGLKRATYNATEEMRTTLRKTLKDEFSRVRPEIEGLMADFVKKSDEDPSQIDTLRGYLERRFIELKNREAALLESIRRNMEDLSEDLVDGLTSYDRVSAMEQEVVRLEEKLELYQDFAQIGMSVGILQHEFEKTVHALRRAMRDMKPWADRIPKLQAIYRRFRDSFDHLDGYLTMLDPLGRRLRRSKIELSGDQIRAYTRRIFGPRLEKDGIQLKTTTAFDERTVSCHSSALLGAFVNIVDNAAFWVVQGAEKERLIEMDVDEKGFLISNTGPGIEDRYRDRIFEFGESMKLKGRGMGLSVSQETLKREGFQLELIQYGRDVKPVFRITTEMDDEGGDDDESVGKG